MVPVHSPATIFGRYSAFCSGVAVHQDRGDRALGQARIHREGEIGRRQELVDLLGHEHRQTLAAELARRGDADPAALHDLSVGVLEALGRGHAAVVVAGAALDVANAIERGKYVFAEFSGFAENSLDEVGRGVSETREIGVALDVEHVIEQEQHVIDGRLVGRHVGGSPPQETSKYWQVTDLGAR